ncbi:helix-turn-helix domain-containing protein [Clostridium cellulovorans]|uniref:Helix-turn-helix domain protein n=1 Tax=Clostridium cellulovorans (strain ATCC 35296 / DSM 3052 / OCM 3 / 743B) TaxID=573061 RepID=D9SRC2_CLOC7|nr:helix-turn-helix transcriptional regulator [Clostridium cellulovorans]ADL52351.1 helix-turn-helix domain protein [Clostridium cellulovorans 743B]
MNIGEKIKQYRNLAGLSIRVLAAKADISKSTLGDIENGKTNTSVKTITSIAEALNVDVNILMNAEATDDNETPLPKILDVKTAMDLILAQPGLMLNGEMLSNDSKIALANALQLGLQYAEQMQKKEKELNQK